MTEPATTVLSVRGEAQRVVAPDSARIDARVTTIESTKAAALRVTAAGLRKVLDDLAKLGGAVLDSVDQRRGLGWVAYSAVTWDDQFRELDRRRPTGRFGAGVSLFLAVRDFTLMEGVGEVVAANPLLELDGVSWSVDNDNAAWAQVRAAAIETALAKGRDYAAALGGTVTTVEHIADAGLLGSQMGSRVGWREQESAVFLSGRSVEGGSLQLDPMPQTLSAVIEARFVASVAPLS